MTNDIIKDKSKSLQSLLPTSFDINQNTENAIVFYKLNKEGLKYLLTAYKYYGRAEILVNYLEKEFGIIDKKTLYKLLKSDNIYTKSFLSNRLYIYIPIITVLLILWIAIAFQTYTFILVLFPAAIVYIAVGLTIEEKMDTYYVNYKLSAEYKHQPTPDKKL